SVGLFTLQNADVKSVMSELDKAIGDKAGGPLASIFKIIPIERMNAILVVSPNAAYVEEAKKWVERLDRGGGGDAPRFYVYNLEHTSAEHVAPLLQQAFTGRSSTTTTSTAPSVAPGTPAGTIVSPPTFSAQPAIVAPPAEFQVIEQALRKLDVPARQIVMEMAIVEVTLTDEFQAGVDWVFKGGAPSGRGYGGNVANPNPAANSAALVGNAISGALSGGFSYLIG